MEIEAGSAVVAPGPWIRDFVPELGKRLKLTRQPLLWFSPVHASCALTVCRSFPPIV